MVSQDSNSEIKGSRGCQECSIRRQPGDADGSSDEQGEPQKLGKYGMEGEGKGRNWQRRESRNPALSPQPSGHGVCEKEDSQERGAVIAVPKERRISFLFSCACFPLPSIAPLCRALDFKLFRARIYSLFCSLQSTMHMDDAIQNNHHLRDKVHLSE